MGDKDDVRSTPKVHKMYTWTVQN